jgi:hypothetical protein
MFALELECGKKRVWTMSTLFFSDRPVLPPDCPDSAYFRGFPAFPRAGMQFESHLGHVFSLVRGGFAFNVCALTLRGSF